MSFRAVNPLVGLLFVLITGSLANGQANRNAFFEQQRKQYLQSIKQYPLLDKHKIEDLFTFRLEGNELVVQPHLEPDHEYQQRRAEIDGLAEPAVVLCWLISQDLGQVQFEFNADDYSSPGVYGRLHILSRPNNIELEKTWQTPAGFRRIMFMQANGTVHVNIFANDGPNGFTNVNLVEKDFLTLRRLHPLEIERWLRPVFQEVRQEAAFSPDMATAWQILADDWPWSGKLEPSIAARVRELDDDDFRVREKASHALWKLGRDGALAMLRMNRGGFSPEQNLRLDEVIARYKPLSDAEARRLRDDPRFLIDCLYCDDATARRLSLERLRKLTGKAIDFDPDAPEEVRTPAVHAIREKLFPPAAPASRPR